MSPKFDFRGEPKCCWLFSCVIWPLSYGCCESSFIRSEGTHFQH